MTLKNNFPRFVLLLSLSPLLFNACNCNLDDRQTFSGPRLSLELKDYNQEEKRAVYQIQNLGNKKIKHTQFYYRNISKDAEEKQVLINDAIEESINIRCLKPHGHTEIKAQLNFPNKVTKATFRLELRSAKNEKTITHLVNEFKSPTNSSPSSPKQIGNNKTNPNKRYLKKIDTTPWKQAIAEDNLTTLKSLFKTAKDVNQQDLQGKTILHHLAQGGLNKKIDRTLTQYLFELPGIDVNRQDAANNTALHTACYNADHQYFNVLLEHGARADIPNQAGETALTRAFDANDAYKVSRILKNDVADITSLNGPGYNALEESLYKGKLKMATVLIQYGAQTNLSPNNLLHIAIDKQTTDNSAQELIELLLNKRVPVNTPDDKDTNQNTLLHKATQRGYKDIVASLISHKADVNATNSQGKTPLDLLDSIEYQGKEEEKQEIKELLTNASR